MLCSITLLALKIICNLIILGESVGIFCIMRFRMSFFLLPFCWIFLQLISYWRNISLLIFSSSLYRPLNLFITGRFVWGGITITTICICMWRIADSLCDYFVVCCFYFYELFLYHENNFEFFSAEKFRNDMVFNMFFEIGLWYILTVNFKFNWCVQRFKNLSISICH